jgi:hypothetical protein
MNQKRINNPLSNAILAGYERYKDGAVVLAFSVQIAAVVMLIKKDFGLSAVEFGELTMEVTWAAALLTILPILLICLIRPKTSLTRSKSEEDRDLPLVWISVTWILFFFTFVSRMVSYYSKGQVGSGGQTVISIPEAKSIRDLCFQGVSTVSAPEHLAFEFFAIGGSLFTSILVILILVDGVGQKRQLAWSTHFHDSAVFARLNTSAGRGVLIFNTIIWGAPQIWAIFRFRNFQSALARSVDRPNIDNEWSFGQIMAVVVFLPVPIQVVYELLQQPEIGDSSSLHQNGVRSLSDKAA